MLLFLHPFSAQLTAAWHSCEDIFPCLYSNAALWLWLECGVGSTTLPYHVVRIGVHQKEYVPPLTFLFMGSVSCFQTMSCKWSRHKTSSNTVRFLTTLILRYTELSDPNLCCILVITFPHSLCPFFICCTQAFLFLRYESNVGHVCHRPVVCQHCRGKTGVHRPWVWEI